MYNIALIPGHPQCAGTKINHSRLWLSLNILNAFFLVNPLECKGNYSATLNNTKLVVRDTRCVILGISRDALYWKMNMTMIHWPLMGGPLHLVQRGG